MNMNAFKPMSRDDIEQYMKERKGLEVELLDEILKSRARERNVARGAVLFAFGCLGVMGYQIHRYSQPVTPNLLVMDKSTGSIEQVSLLEEQSTYGDVIDSYWIGQFVIHYETYDFNNAQAHYDAVGLMASGSVAEEYRKRYEGENRLDKVLGDSEMTRVKIVSVIPDREHGVATVRYTTQKKYRTRPAAEPPQYWIATVGYVYDNMVMTPAQRQINPLGFRATSFDPHRETAANVGG